MAKNKKPRKKYVPRPTYHPNLINQMHSFGTFEAALDRLLETGECTVDDFGCLTFMGSNGTVQSFESTLRVYIHVLEICNHRKLIELDTRSLSVLQNRMFERKGFDEEEILTAKVVLDKARRALSTINQVVMRDILNVVRTTLAMEKTAPDSVVKNPEEALHTYYRIAGKLSYDEVVQRNQEYQQLAIDHPEDQILVAIRDIYVKYLTAYNFVRRDEKFRQLDQALGL